MEQRFGPLMDPIRVGSAALSNRVAVTAHTYGLADDGGVPAEEMHEYVMARARGGCAMLVMGETLANRLPQGNAQRRGASLSSDQVIPFYERLAAAVEP